MPMDFAKAGSRVRKLLAPTKPKDLSASVLTPDPLRDNVVREAAANSAMFRDALREVPELELTRDEQTTKVEWEGYAEAMRDFARASYGFDEPELLSPEKIRPSHLLNHAVSGGAFGSEWFREQRPYTRGNAVESIVGAKAYGDELVKLAQERVGDQVERSEAIAEEEQRAQSAEELFEQLRQQAREEIEDFGEVQPQTKRDLKAEVKAMDAAQAKLGGLMDDQAQAGMARATAVGQAAAEAAKQAVDGVRGIPGVAKGTATNLPLDKQIELAKKWADTPNLREISRIVGRMLKSMIFKRNAEVKNVPQIPVGIRSGNDLARVLPQELARASHPSAAVRATFYADYASRALLQRDMNGQAPAGKGPIIVVMDGSGSMSGAKFMWASSLALALFTIAQRERRAFACVEFGSKGQLKAWTFPKGAVVDPDEVLDMTTHFFNGGTHIASGLEGALAIVTEHPAFSTADVVLIGDGEDHTLEDGNRAAKALRDRQVRIHGISVGAQRLPYFEAVCDWHTNVSDLAGPSDVTDRLATSLS